MHEDPLDGIDENRVEPLARVHYLKTWPCYFMACQAGRKHFEYRKKDRDFQVGDTVVLREWVPQKNGGGAYTGKEIIAEITYLMSECPGLPRGYCVFEIEKRRFPF